MGKRLAAHVARHAETDAVVDGRHDPLQDRRQSGKHRKFDCQIAHGSKIDLSGADDLVDCVADQNGDIERARHAGRGQQQGHKQQRQIPSEAFYHAPQRPGGCMLHDALTSPFSCDRQIS